MVEFVKNCLHEPFPFVMSLIFFNLRWFPTFPFWAACFGYFVPLLVHRAQRFQASWTRLIPKSSTVVIFIVCELIARTMRNESMCFVLRVTGNHITIDILSYIHILSEWCNFIAGGEKKMHNACFCCDGSSSTHKKNTKFKKIASTCPRLIRKRKNEK